MKEIILVDSSIYTYKAFSRNRPLLSILETISFTLNKLNKRNALVYFLFDSKSWRSEVFKEYKAQRKANREKYQTKSQLDKFQQFRKDQQELPNQIKYFGRVLKIDGLEADDIASVVSDKLKDKEDYHVTMITEDKDWIKFLEDNADVYYTNKDLLYTKKDFTKEYGFEPEKLAVIDAFTGVSKENVQGIRGFGAKSFMKYFDVNAPIEELKEDIHEAYKVGRQPERFKDTKEMFDFNYTLFKRMYFKDLNEKQQITLKEQMNTPQIKFKNKNDMIMVCSRFGFIPNKFVINQFLPYMKGAK